ncbi:MAG: PAS domain-containing sensor histidine kinase [Sulfitobacter sp.]
MNDPKPLLQRDRVQSSPFDDLGEGNFAPSIDRVVSLMPGFVYVFNHQTNSNDYTNRSVGEHLGYSSDEIRGFGPQMLMKVIHPDDLALLATHFGRIVALDGDLSVAIEYRVITKAGALRWLRSVDTVFDRDEDGQVLRHIGCASDITIEKESELRLSELNAKLENRVKSRTHDLEDLNTSLEERISARTLQLQEAVVELEQLTYIATHDLKVPVNNLTRLGLMLQSNTQSLSAEQIEQVGWINDCAEQLGEKIQGLVLVAQIRLGNGNPSVPLGLSGVITAAVDLMQSAMPKDSFPVSIDVPDDMVVQFERSEIENILAALLDNAVKYAEPDRPLDIKIAAGTTSGQIWVSVADNGTGLDSKLDAEKAFGLFQRAHKTPAGSGISLYCARRMLHRRGGTLTFHGHRGEGAEFTILFAKEESRT